MNVFFIVVGVALVLGGGDFTKKQSGSRSMSVQGILMLVISLCFDGGLGAFEDRLVAAYSIQPFDLMFKIHVSNAAFAGTSLVVLNELHILLEKIHEMGYVLCWIYLCGALGQVFIFLTIAKFGAVTCSIMGLARKVTSICASIVLFGHHLDWLQLVGLFIGLVAMMENAFSLCSNNPCLATDGQQNLSMAQLGSLPYWSRTCKRKKTLTNCARFSGKISATFVLAFIALRSTDQHQRRIHNMRKLNFFPKTIASNAGADEKESIQSHADSDQGLFGVKEVQGLRTAAVFVPNVIDVFTDVKSATSETTKKTNIVTTKQTSGAVVV